MKRASRSICIITLLIFISCLKKDETKDIPTAKVESKIRMRDLNINRILTLCDRSKAGIDISTKALRLREKHNSFNEYNKDQESVK